MITNQRVVEYINSLEKELPKHLDILEKSALEQGVPIIRKETQTLLRFLLKYHQPKKILEVGTAIGFSAIFMSEYMPDDCNITTIEKVEMRLEKARVNLSTSPKSDRITLLEGDANQILQELADKNMGSYDFIFMDAAKGQYMNFLPNIMKLLKLNGLLITDNVLQDGSIASSRYAITRRDRTIHTRMREYLHALTHMEELETVILPHGDGVTLSTKVK